MALDERLKRELERTARPADPSGIYEDLIRRRERRRIIRRAQTGAVAVAVIAVSAAGVFGLSRIFGESPRQKPAAPVSMNGVIIVSREVPGEGEHLFAIAPDGSDERRLTPEGRAVYRSPDVSPDGRSVVVAHEIPSFEPGVSVLALLPVDGGSPEWLTDPHLFRDPAWSPDGERIAFAGSVSGPFGIYILEVETGETLLVPGTDEISVGHPTWSPDGTRVAFEASTDSDTDPAQTWDIYTVDIDATGMTNVTNTPDVSEVQPAWSWTTDRIAFIEVGPAEGALRTMAPDGTDAITAFSGELAPGNPVWSPDGTSIAFEVGGAEVGSENVLIVDAEGDGPLVDPNILGTDPAWQPLLEGSVVEPSPSPTESPSPPEGEDIGLPFRVCSPERLGGVDYLGDGTDGTAWTGTPVKDDGTCRAGPERYIVAADHTGDGIADSWTDLPFGCYVACAPSDATDLDANGREELIVTSFFSIMDFYFFTIASDAEGNLAIEPILVAGPGHEPAGITAGEPLRIDAWGDAGYGSTIECEGFPEDTVIVWSWSYAQVDSNQPSEVHVTRLELRDDGLFHVIGTNDYTVPAGEPTGLPYQGDLGRQCGVGWGR